MRCGILDAVRGKDVDLVEMQIRVRRKPALTGGDVRTESCRRLHAGRDVKLFEQIMHVILNGGDLDVELDGDLFVGESPVDQPEHPALARR